MQSHMHLAERDALMQKYDYLLAECERLKARLSTSLTTYSSASSSSSSSYYNNSAFAPLSTYPSKSPSPPISSPQSRRQSTSGSVPTHPDPRHSYYVSAALDDEEDEQALLRVQQQIKAVLTSLLNCKDVKNDQNTRAWVQQRLMDAEHDIRTGRRRRRSGCDGVSGVSPLSPQLVMSRKIVT